MSERVTYLEVIWSLTDVELCVVASLAKLVRGQDIKRLVAWAHVVSAAAPLNTNGLRLLAKRGDSLASSRRRAEIVYGPIDNPRKR
jgi:hypothetical protein